MEQQIKMERRDKNGTASKKWNGEMKIKRRIKTERRNKNGKAKGTATANGK